MGTTDTGPAPDLSGGIPLDELVDSVPVTGTVGGEPVLVVRLGDNIHAVGGACTHYGTPLDKGIIHDGTIRCPSHHACFSLATGTSSAPGLAHLPCYATSVEGDKLIVGARLTRSPLPVGASRQVVIIGAGAAGTSCAISLRRRGFVGKVFLVGAEPTVPVDRPNLSKDYLAGTAPEEWIPLRPAEAYAADDIELVLDTHVTSVNISARHVRFDDARTLDYDLLVFATGAEPIRLGIPGANLPHVNVLRSLSDSRSIIAHIATMKTKHAVVIGASFIGLEVAAALVARGLTVDVVAPETRPLERILGPAVGDAVRTVHEKAGVRFHLGTTPKEITATEVLLSDGTTLAAELVIMGVGVRPRIALAETAGVAVDKGILTDENLHTNVAGVYACGDVARVGVGKVRVEHWAVAGRQGETVAENIVGGLKTPTTKHAWTAPPFFWSIHHDLTLQVVGNTTDFDQIDVHGDLAARDATLAYRRVGRTIAVVTVGRERTSLAAEAALAEGDQDALAAFGVAR